MGNQDANVPSLTSIANNFPNPTLRRVVGAPTRTDIEEFKEKLIEMINKSSNTVVGIHVFFFFLHGI